jgi:hypothetical protein
VGKISWVTSAVMLFGLSVHSADAGYTILPQGSIIAGKSIADWTAAWWTWGLQAPASTNPLYDPTGAFANVNNDGPVFFIAGNTASRTFTVPAGKPVLLPLINIFDIESVPPDDPVFSLAERQAAAAAVVNTWVGAVDTSSLFVSIDGNAVLAPSSYLEVTGFFDMGPTQPGSLLESFGVPSGTAATPTKSAGYWLMITDLSPGSHELTFGGSSDAFDIPQNCCFNGTFGAFSTVTNDSVVVTPEPTSTWLILPGVCGLIGLRIAVHKRPRVDTAGTA